MRAFPAALLLLPLVALPSSCAVIPTDCDATESFAEKALDLINKGRRHGYLFQLLRVADAHVDESESVAVYYLVLDVKESDCSVLSRKHWNDCKPALSARLSDIVIGQCKVIATKCLNESQYLRVNDFNCTTSSVSSALANTKDSSILFDFFEDTQPYRTQADKALEKYKQENGDFASFKVDRLERVVRARGGERTNYYVDFSVRNCSVSHHFHRHHNAFGFCRADLSYDIEVSDLESPKDIAINCEVFNFAEHRNFSGKHHHFGHPHGPPPHGPPPHGPPPHGHHPHGPCPHGRPPFGPPPHGHPPHGHHPHGHPPHGHHPHGPPPHKHHPHGPPPHGPPPHGPPPHEHHPHGHPPHGPPPHGPPPHEHHPHGHPPHGPPPHGPPPHEHHPHGHPPHGPPPHGPPPHEHHPHGHPPHGPPPHEHHPHGHHPHKHHPHDHDFLDHGPCDLPPHSQSPQDHHRQGQGPPPQHSEERGPGKKHFPFHRRQIGYVYRLPPLKKDEVLPLPEANFPSFSLPDHSHPLKPEIQPFPESVSESCPGVFKNDFSNISKFFAYSLPK